jgi:hypothetical protein
MFLKKVGAFGAKVAMSPLTSRVIRGTRAVADVAGMAGVPGASALAKGLGVAEKVLTAVQKQ